MARPQRCRRICSEPAFTAFSPNDTTDRAPVVLTLDEYGEVIRLVDFGHQTHEQCAEQMDIARSTVTEMYEKARHKIADCIVNGRPLSIEGGHVRLCDGTFDRCFRKHCHRQRSLSEAAPVAKGEKQMRIAVTYENGDIFQHFGHTAQFKLYDTQDGRVVASQVVDTNGSGHGALADFLAQNRVEALICGGIGGGAQTALAEAGIRLYGGVSGKADNAVEALLLGVLRFNPDVRCSHHDHEHGGEGHTCGSHGCGKHGCH